MRYVVDVLGFKLTSKKFIFKEISFAKLDVHNDIPIVIFTEPPFPWEKLKTHMQQRNKWLSANYHGLEWESGNISYECGIETFQMKLADADIVYTKGLEKAKWLEKVLPCKYVFFNICKL